MDTSWRQWCRLCAQASSPIGIFGKNESGCNLAELILKYVHLKVDPLDEFPLTICNTCYQFILSVAKFADQVSRVDSMYAGLNCNNMSFPDLSFMKYQFGIVKEEPLIWNSKCDRSTDTMDLNVEWNESKFDPLAAAEHDEKEIMEVDVCIAELPGIVSDDDCDSEDSFMPDMDDSEYNDLPERKPLKRYVKDTLKSESADVTNEEKPMRKIPTPRKGRSYPCNKCDASFSKQQELRLHRKSLHATVKKEQSYTCDACGLTFPKRSELRLHKKTLHPAPVPQKEFPCEKCEKIFPTRKRLRQHALIHLDPSQRESFTCACCDKIFKNRNNLKQHLRKVHLNDRPYMCEVCGKSFVSNCELKEHNYTHMDETPFKCSTCNKQFTTHSGLKKHVDTHSATTYMCPDCGLILNTRRTLQRHMVVHSDQKNYKCTVCHSEFKRAKSLKNHLILHTGLRPYSCQFCDKTFANGSNCRSHKKKAHPLELAAMEVAGVSSQETKLPELKHLKIMEAI